MLLLLLLLVGFLGSRSDEGDARRGKVKTPALAEVAASGEASVAAVVASTGASVALDGALPTGNQAIAEFQALATCAKYRRIKTSVAIWEEDPFSFLNNEEARADLSPEALNGIREQTEFVDMHSDQCERESSDNGLQARIYRAALAAGYAGDLRAATCYVAAPWPHDDENGAPAASIRDEYVANVQKMVVLGLQGGDWNMVALLISAHASIHTHGLLAIGFPNDPVKAYGYQWLQKLGARGDLAREAERSLVMFASRISPDDIARQQRWAEDMYRRYFSRHPTVTTSGPSCD